MICQLGKLEIGEFSWLVAYYFGSLDHHLEATGHLPHLQI